MPKVYMPGCMSCYWPHESFGEPSLSLKDFVHNPDEYSLVVLPGGADIDPSFYGHEMNPRTFVSPQRDKLEGMVVDLAIKNGIPIAGICRGGQLLIAKAGGYLYQHVTGHHANHMARTHDGQEFMVTSCHHQMFGWPLPQGSELIAWSAEHRSECYEVAEGEGDRPVYEPECVFLPKIKALATQWHPEWMDDPKSNGHRYYNYLLEKYLRPLTERRMQALA